MNIFKKAKDMIFNQTEDSLIWFSLILMAVLLFILTVFKEPIFNYLVKAIDSYQLQATRTEKSVDDGNKSNFVMIKAENEDKSYQYYQQSARQEVQQ